VSSSSNVDRNLRDCGKHELVDAEDDGWDSGVANRGFFKHTLVAKMHCVTISAA